MSRLRLSWLPVLAALPATAFVVARLPIAMASYPMGSTGGQYSPHIARLEAVLDTRALVRGDLDFMGWVRRLDGEYPPLMPVTHALAGVPFGHSMEAGTLFGWVWVLLLAWATGATAAELSPGGRHGRTGQWAYAVAASAVVLCGPLQAFSLRTYFDLPMLALFQAAVVLLLRARGPKGAIAAASVAMLACVAKWTALPLLLITGAGVLLRAVLSPRADRGRRLGVLAVTLAALGALLAGWFATVPIESDRGSYAEMTGTFDENPLSVPAPAWVEALLPPALVRAVERTSYLDQDRGPMWRQFQLRWMVWSVLSPLVVLLCAPLWVVWTLRGCPGGTVLITTFVGHWLFLLFLVPVEDERFFLSGAVAAVAAAGLGLAGLPGRTLRGVAAAALIVASGAIAWEFHFGDDPMSAEIDGPLARCDDPGSWRARSSHHPDLSWARGDEEMMHAPKLRAAMWRWVQACDPDWIGLGDFHRARRQTPVLGEWRWWEVQFLDEAIAGRPVRRAVATADPNIEEEFTFGIGSTRTMSDLYFSPWPAGEDIRPPPGPAPGSIRLLGSIPPQDEHWNEGATVWRPVDLPDCGPAP